MRRSRLRLRLERLSRLWPAMLCVLAVACSAQLVPPRLWVKLVCQQGQHHEGSHTGLIGRVQRTQTAGATPEVIHSVGWMERVNVIDSHTCPAFDSNVPIQTCGPRRLRTQWRLLIAL